MRIASWRVAMALGLLLALGVLAGCGKGTESGQDVGKGISVSPGAQNELPNDIQRVGVTIDRGTFDAARYAVQTGAVQLAVTTRGGPYTLAIDPLVRPVELPADTTTTVGFTAPEAGEYAMKLTGGGAAPRR